jgi:hypothetical protein
MKKECNVVIVPIYGVRNKRQRTDYPFICELNKTCVYSIYGDHHYCADDNLYGTIGFGHLELRDENGVVMATTRNQDNYSRWKKGILDYPSKNPNIPKSFIDEFIKSKGQTKKVLVEMEPFVTEHGNKITEECPIIKEIPKVDSDGCVIIHPVIKTEMKIDDIPVDEIKYLLNIIGGKQPSGRRECDCYCIVTEWLENNF